VKVTIKPGMLCRRNLTANAYLLRFNAFHYWVDDAKQWMERKTVQKDGSIQKLLEMLHNGILSLGMWYQT